MEEKPQIAISKIVEDYIRMFPREYALVVKMIGKIRVDQLSSNKQDKFGGIKKVDVLERKIGEYPETLDTMFTSKLDSEDLGFFKSKKGSIWFYKKYKQFATSVI